MIDLLFKVFLLLLVVGTPLFSIAFLLDKLPQHIKDKLTYGKNHKD